MADRPFADIAELRKITTFFRKNTIFNEHPVLTNINISCSHVYMYYVSSINHAYIQMFD